jgi:DNA-binding NarL/FixJ family response regulator
MVQKKLEEENANKLDFTKPELEYILNNANFTIEQEEIFKMLTSKYGRASIVNIAIKMNMSESTVKRRIKQIKNKILRLL